MDGTTVQLKEMQTTVLRFTSVNGRGSTQVLPPEATPRQTRKRGRDGNPSSRRKRVRSAGQHADRDPGTMAPANTTEDDPPRHPLSLTLTQQEQDQTAADESLGGNLQNTNKGRDSTLGQAASQEEGQVLRSSERAALEEPRASTPSTQSQSWSNGQVQTESNGNRNPFEVTETRTETFSPDPVFRPTSVDGSHGGRHPGGQLLSLPSRLSPPPSQLQSDGRAHLITGVATGDANVQEPPQFTTFEMFASICADHQHSEPTSQRDTTTNTRSQLGLTEILPGHNGEFQDREQFGELTLLPECSRGMPSETINPLQTQFSAEDNDGSVNLEDMFDGPSDYVTGFNCTQEEVDIVSMFGGSPLGAGKTGFSTDAGEENYQGGVDVLEVDKYLHEFLDLSSLDQC